MSGGQSDEALLRAARQGDRAAWEAFVRRWSDLLYGCCRQVFGEGECRDAFPALVARLGANRLAALADWDGRSRLQTFLALKAADLLAERITSLLATEWERGWLAFERFFAADLTRIVRRRLAVTGLGAEDGEDVAQELRLRLMAEGGAALRRYDGRGSFSGYIRRIVHNLVEDILRAMEGRRREPEAIKRLGPLERRAYALVHLQGYRADQLPQLLRGDDGRTLPAAEATRLLAAVDAALGGRPPAPPPRAVSLTVTTAGGAEVERVLPAVAESPEQALSSRRERGAMEHAMEALATALARLPAEARSYIQHRFLAEPPLPPRRIAALMGLPVDDLYRRRAGWERQLRHELAVLGIDKFPGPSV